MLTSRGRATGKPAEVRTATFTGTVYLDPVLRGGDAAVNDVTFTPGARTFWHSHPGGQLLIVKAGLGIVATRAGEVSIVRAGDVIWAVPDEEHWHGALADSLLTHLAVSLGATQWHGEVSGVDYAKLTAPGQA